MHTNVMRKLIVDILMLVGMFCSMGLQMFGAGTHKMTGLLTFTLFVTHNVLNRQWYMGLFKGKYSSIRRIHTILNFVLVLAMIGIMASGVMLSRELAAGNNDAMTTGRILHSVSSYAGCIGVALHIGFHLRRRNHYDD